MILGVLKNFVYLDISVRQWRNNGCYIQWSLLMTMHWIHVDQLGGNHLDQKQIHLRGSHLDQIEGWQDQYAQPTWCRHWQQTTIFHGSDWEKSQGTDRCLGVTFKELVAMAIDFLDALSLAMAPVTDKELPRSRHHSIQQTLSSSKSWLAMSRLAWLDPFSEIISSSNFLECLILQIRLLMEGTL